MMTIIEIRLIMVCIYFVNTVKAYMMLMSMPVTELQRNLKISKKLFKWYCVKYLLKLLKWEIGLGQLIIFHGGIFDAGIGLPGACSAFLRLGVGFPWWWLGPCCVNIWPCPKTEFSFYIYTLLKIWDTVKVLKRN